MNNNHPLRSALDKLTSAVDNFSRAMEARRLIFLAAPPPSRFYLLLRQAVQEHDTRMKKIVEIKIFSQQ